jgi:hypothetical protein
MKIRISGFKGPGFQGFRDSGGIRYGESGLCLLWFDFALSKLDVA